MNLKFDYYHNLEGVELRLCNPDGRELFPILGRNRNLVLRFNDLSELTFDIDSKLTLSNGTAVDVEAYDYIQTKRLVYATDIGWFQIDSVTEHDDGETKYKSIIAQSYQSVFKNKGFLSEERVYCFYNPSDPHDERYDSSSDDAVPSVLGQWSRQLGVQQDLSQGLDRPSTPYTDWTVTYVHDSLIYTENGGTCRTFKEDTTFGYDWMVNDVANAFGVVVLFDFMYKTIRVMTPDEVTEKTSVVYTFRNFMKGIDIDEKADDIVTVLNCNGDNCDITSVNPTGTNYICNFSYYMDKTHRRWMSDELIAKLEAWEADCATEKATYQIFVRRLRNMYARATETEVLLKEMSLSLTDLRTAQNRRSVLGDGKPGDLCGIVIAESVKTSHLLDNGYVSYFGGRSIHPTSNYHSSNFDADSSVTAYEFAPQYDSVTRQWDWSHAGATMVGSASDIIAHNLSDSNTSGKSYWYFADSGCPSSYCKLLSAVIVVNDSTVINYCGGFDRYIAYTYPMRIPSRVSNPSVAHTKVPLEEVLSDVHDTFMPWQDIMVKYGIDADDATGTTTVYVDHIAEWIDLREKLVGDLNIELYGYALTTGSGGSLQPTDESIYGQINFTKSRLGEISSRLNIISYFASTPELLRELNCYWIEGDYTNENIAVLETTTPDEAIDLANELMAAGYVELSKVCQPRFSFSIESIDAMKQYEFRDQMRQLELGKIITIEKEEGLWYYPALLEISMNLDEGADFSMIFANSMRLDDWGYTYADLISDASSTSRKVSANWQELLAYSKEREEIASLVKDPLDTTLRAATANMVNQEFKIDQNGILGRKRISENSDQFADEQIRLINNSLVFTDDNWKTARTALGKIYYKDPVTKLDKVGYGLIAETIIGSLVVGENLSIINKDNSINLGEDGIVIKDGDGNIVFQAGTNGSLTVHNYVTEDQLTSELAAKVSNVNTGTSFGWNMTSTQFSINSGGEDVLVVDEDGLCVKGEIRANTGNIATWTIGDTTNSYRSGIYTNALFTEAFSSDGKTGELFMMRDGGSSESFAIAAISLLKKGSGDNPYPNDEEQSFDNGKGYWETRNFYVRRNGELFARRAKIQGVLTASPGSSIGNFVVGDDGNLSLTTTGDSQISNWLDVIKESNNYTHHTRISTGAIQLTRTNPAGTKQYIVIDASSTTPKITFTYPTSATGSTSTTFRHEGSQGMTIAPDANGIYFYGGPLGVYYGSGTSATKYDGVTGWIAWKDSALVTKYGLFVKGILVKVTSTDPGTKPKEGWA